MPRVILFQTAPRILMGRGALAQGVMKVTRLLANHPRRIMPADAEAIYREVL